MSFDSQKFMTIDFKDRIESVPVPRLKKFFEGDPVWKVRGLTGLESAIAKKAAQDNKSISAIIDAIGTKRKQEMIDGIKELTGIGDDKVPDELVQRYSWIEQGSVDPECDHDLAMALARNFPEDFYHLTNRIMALTGAGRLGE